MSKEYLFTINTINLIGANQDYELVGVISNPLEPGFENEYRTRMPDAFADELNDLLGRWVRSDAGLKGLMHDGSEVVADYLPHLPTWRAEIQSAIIDDLQEFEDLSSVLEASERATRAR